MYHSKNYADGDNLRGVSSNPLIGVKHGRLILSVGAETQNPGIASALSAQVDLDLWIHQLSLPYPNKQDHE